MTLLELAGQILTLPKEQQAKDAVAFVLIGSETGLFKPVTEVLVETSGRPVIVTGRENV